MCILNFFVLFSLAAAQCSYLGPNFLNNIDGGLYGETTTLLEVQSFLTYTSCPYTMTATAGVELASQTYTATVTYTMFEPSQNVEATFNFPEIQVDDLTNGAILTFSHQETGTAENLPPLTITPNTYMATISSGGSCLGFACDGWITLLSNCSASYGSAYSVQPFMYESCVCANSTAFQNYATACYNCYSGLGNSAGASTIASIIQNCRPSASLTSTGVPVTTVPTVAASTSMTSTEAQCGVNGLYTIEPFQSSNVSTLQETEMFTGVLCPFTITATAVATIDGNTFQADTLTYTLPSQTEVTFNYPGVTLSTIASGEVITISHRATGNAPNTNPVTFTPKPYTVTAWTTANCFSTACQAIYSSLDVCDSTTGLTPGSVLPYIACLCSDPSSLQQEASSCYQCYESLGSQDGVNLMGSVYTACAAIFSGNAPALTTTSAVNTVSFVAATTPATTTTKSQAARSIGPDVSSIYTIIIVGIFFGLWAVIT